MPNDDTPQNATTPQGLRCPGVPRERDPVIFSGTDEQDVEDWLASYERVSVNNRWDDNDKLGRVHFYLRGVAELWLTNHEAEISNWASFKTTFADVFGRPTVRKLRAEQRLRDRAQLAGECFTSYIEDVVGLCRRFNPVMSEADKVKHILKGIEDDAFHMLVAKNPETVADVIQHCQSYDELRKQRISTRRPSLDTTSTSAVTVGAISSDPAVLTQQIQQFIREEVARQLSLAPFLPGNTHGLPSSLRQTIEEQVSEALPPTHQPPPVSAPLTYADVARRQSHALPHGPDSALPSNAFYSTEATVGPHVPLYRRPVTPPNNPWRTPDNRPICYYCRLPGHVERFCRRRVPRPGTVDPSYSYARTEPPQPMPSQATSDPSSSNRRTFNSRRSPSPRRRSLSPMIRRPSPVQTEN